MAELEEIETTRPESPHPEQIEALLDAVPDLRSALLSNLVEKRAAQRSSPPRNPLNGIRYPLQFVEERDPRLRHCLA
jgi:hypothetical protein